MNFVRQLLLFVVILSCSSALASNENEIDAIVNRALEEFHVPGIALSLIVGDEILYCRGYGLRDIENQLPVTENTAFLIASNTKAFTSFILAQLVEEGKIAWDDPVIKYIPKFRLYHDELSSQVTIRDLIAHRTGIPRHDVLWYQIRDLTEDELLNALPHFPPVAGLRETFLYTNLMYVVAGIVIRNITGNPWEQEISSRILKPLQMNHSGSSPLQCRDQIEFSQPYVKIGDKIQKLPILYPSSTLAASALHSSAFDMAKWVQVQLLDQKRQNFMQRETLNEMHAIHMPFTAQSRLGSNTLSFSTLDPSGYGLGWQIDAYRGHKQVHHGGTLDGFFSEVSLLPDVGIGLVILTNSSTDGAYAIACIKNQIYDLLLDQKDTNWSEKIQEERQKSMAASHLPSLQKYEGFYTHPAYGTMQIAVEYDSLIATLGRMKVQLKQKEDGVFEAKFPSLLAYGIDPFIEFSFFSNSLGEVNEVHVPFEHFRSAPPIIFKK